MFVKGMPQQEKDNDMISVYSIIRPRMIIIVKYEK